jgi:hypothetical protein
MPAAGVLRRVRRVLLRDAGEFDRLAVRKFRHKAQAATHGLDGFPQSPNAKALQHAARV